MSAVTLRRYTNLASAIHVLRNRCLTLLNPASWDDRNDAYFLAQYKERISAATVLALCFAEAPETYHRWRVFSSGGDGVCLEFDKPQLLEAVRKDGTVTARAVIYRQINDVCAAPINDDNLPFLKRFPYEDEQEFRLLNVERDIETEYHHIPIALSAISRITLSPWMPAPLVKAVKETMKELEGCEGIKIYQSTLIENERWKNAANPRLDQKGT